jgi:predicted short-subunit dehydrogenase-like oxidoreductase (DUF2520 family)
MQGDPEMPRAVLIGAGRVGTAVTIMLRRAGWHIAGIASRTEASARRASERIGAAYVDLHGDIPQAELYVIGATDEGIAALATRLAGRLPDKSVAIHLSGSLGIGVLEPLSRAGVNVCALHPVQTCPDVDTALRRLPGSAWGVTCPDDLYGWSSSLVSKALQGIPVRVAEDARPAWHAASVMTSNGISALLAFGEQLLETIGVDDPVGVLGPLAEGGVANAREGGGGRATITGPIVRGEVETITRHLDALRKMDPDLLEGYRAVATSILKAAVRAGRLSEERQAALREVIS